MRQKMAVDQIVCTNWFSSRRGGLTSNRDCFEAVFLSQMDDLSAETTTAGIIYVREPVEKTIAITAGLSPW